MDKAISLEEQQNKLYRAWNEAQPNYQEPQQDRGSWIMETYPDYVIVSRGEKFYKVAYTEDADQITFADMTEWTAVEHKSEWVETVKTLAAITSDKAAHQYHTAKMERCLKDLKNQGKSDEAAHRICYAALGGDANRGKSNALKALSKTDEELRVGNYIIMFGSRDLEWVRSGKNADGTMGEFFTERTQVESAYTKAGMFHVDWEHGIGKALDGNDAPGADDVLGYVDWRTARTDTKGIWVERVLSRRNEYMKFLEELIEAGLVGTSSEALETGIKRKNTGEILAWPLVRDTLTVSPAEPRMMQENVVSALKNLAEYVPEVKALLQGEGIADADETTERARLVQLKAQAYLLLEE